MVKADQELQPAGKSLYPTQENKTWRTRIRAILQTTEKRHLKPAKKAAITVAAILRMTVKRPLKLAARVARIAMAVAVAAVIVKVSSMTRGKGESLCPFLLTD